MYELRSIKCITYRKQIGKWQRKSFFISNINGCKSTIKRGKKLQKDILLKKINRQQKSIRKDIQCEPSWEFKIKTQ